MSLALETLTTVGNKNFMNPELDPNSNVKLHERREWRNCCLP